MTVVRGVFALLVCVSVGACGGSVEDKPARPMPMPAMPPAPPETEPAMPPVDCVGVTGLEKTDLLAHTGAGFEAVVRLSFDGGVPRAGKDFADCLRVRALDEGRLFVTKSKRSLSRSIVLLLVDAGVTPEENRLARAAAHELLDRLPMNAPVAIYRWGRRVLQVASFGVDRAFLEDRLEVGLGSASLTKDAPAPLADALETARGVLGQVGSGGAAAMRALVIVSPNTRARVDEAAVLAAGPHLLAWLGPSAGVGGAEALPVGLRFPVDPEEGPAPAAQKLVARLDEYRQSAHYGIGYCGDGSARDMRFTIAGSEGEGALITFPAALPENRGPLCQPPPMARGERRFPRRIEFLLTEEERRHAEAIFARPDNRDVPEEDASEPWPLSVRLSPDHEPTRAMAHFRGYSSFRCTRRNYNLKLEGKAPRFMIPGSDANDVHLISMCLDRLYMRNFTAMQLMAEEGLFPVPFDFVELVINGKTQGLYLLTDNVTDSLRRRYPGVVSVVRRRFWDGKSFGEVKWAADGREAAIAMYDGILAGTESLPEADLMGVVRERLNLDQYLRWLAVMNTLQSGDYIDEIFFFAVATLDERGEVRYQQGVMGWDQDDILTDCHHGGELALKDERGLVICAEAELDKRILVNPNVYARYADALGGTLARLTPERFGRALDATAERLLAAFSKPETLEAMIEMWELNPAGRGPVALPVARSLIQTEIAALKERYRQNHRELSARLEAYRAAPTSMGPPMSAP